MIRCDQITDSINVGILTIDSELMVLYMNTWFALHAELDSKKVVGQPLTSLIHLKPEHIISLKRRIKTTLVLQAPSFFTADSDGYLFPMKHSITTKSAFEYMQQDISIVPYNSAQNQVTLLVYDQTVLMEEKNKCHKESTELSRAIAVANETIKKLESAKTKLVKQQEIIYKQAHYDSLTGLANRTLLHQRLQLLIEEGFSYTKKFGVLFLDLDHFKKINDTLGHDAGDELLIKISKILLLCTRKSDTVGRIGGDEFLVLIDDVADEETLMRIAQKIIDTIKEPITIKENMLHVTISIGMSLFPEHGADFNELIKNADIALYDAKAAGRNGYKLFKDDV